jgi:hypothetical protein
MTFKALHFYVAWIDRYGGKGVHLTTLRLGNVGGRSNMYSLQHW